MKASLRLRLMLSGYALQRFKGRLVIVHDDDRQRDINKPLQGARRISFTSSTTRMVTGDRSVHGAPLGVDPRAVDVFSIRRVSVFRNLTWPAGGAAR